MAFDPRTASLEDLAGWTGGAMPGSIVHTRGMAEMTLRQIQTQIAATESQTAAAAAEERAAEAGTRAAKATEKNVKYMFWSVIFAAYLVLHFSGFDNLGKLASQVSNYPSLPTSASSSAGRISSTSRSIRTRRGASTTRRCSSAAICYMWGQNSA